MKNQARPGRALAHPLWISALFVLVINDHVLKGSGLLPGGVTGKLSDVAGLIVAPWVLAVLLAGLLRARGRSALLGAHVAVGVGFSLINVWPLAARGFESLTALTPFPWAITVDPSDLVTLPALVVSWLVLVPASERAPLDFALRAPRLFRGVSFAAGMLACVATSPPAEWWAWGVVAVSDATQLVESDQPIERAFTVRGLRPEVLVDCEAVAEDPTRMLAPELFLVWEEWNLFEARTLGLASDFERECSAWIVEPEGAPSTLFFWQADQGEDRTLPGSALEMNEEDGAMLVFDEGGNVVWSDHPFRFPAPSRTAPALDETCSVPDAGASIAWEDNVPQGSWYLAGVTSSADGCHRLELTGVASTQFFVCLGDDVPLPFSVGEELTIALDPWASPSVRLEIAGTSTTLTLSRGPTLHDDIEFELEDLEGCVGSRDTCGNFLRPARLRVDGKSTVGAGESLALGAGRTLHVMRAMRPAVIDTLCPGSPSSASVWIEAVIVQAPR
jgi:hypothetical protein